MLAHLNQNTTGSAATLTTARTIGGVSFNGSANIDLPGVNSAGNQNTSGTAATVTTAAQPNITSLGTLTTLTVDDITINGSTISDGGDLLIDAEGDITLDANGEDIRFKDNGTQSFVFTQGTGSTMSVPRGSLTVDCAGTIVLDADSGQISFKDANTEIGVLENASSNFKIESKVQDKDIVFAGNDNGSGITALTLDMSDAGVAKFNKGIRFNNDTAAANELDDYEEGTWTPAFVTSGGVTTSSITRTLATYTKIGNIVHIHANVNATLSSLPGQTVSISGLPFAAAGSDQYGIIAVGGHTQNTGGNTPKAHFRTNGSQLDGIYFNASNNTAFWGYNSFDSPTFHMSIHGFYTT